MAVLRILSCPSKSLEKEKGVEGFRCKWYPNHGYMLRLVSFPSKSLKKQRGIEGFQSKKENEKGKRVLAWYKDVMWCSMFYKGKGYVRVAHGLNANGIMTIASRQGNS